MKAKSDLRTPMARIGGLGAGHTGTHHFIAQRSSAVALVPLAIWFVFAGLSLVGGNLADVLVFFQSPVNAVLMFLFLFAALFHMTLGLQVIIEDYISNELLKWSLLVLNRFFAWGVGAASAFALLKISL